MSNAKNIDQSNIKVRRAAVDSVDLYEVKEHELIQLEKGSDADLFLNFAIFLFSIAFACVLTLASAVFKKSIYETFAVVITVVGFVGSLLLILLWLKNKKSIKTIIKQIKDRLPPEVVVATEKEAILIQKTSNLEEIIPSTTLQTTKPAG